MAAISQQQKTPVDHDPSSCLSSFNCWKRQWLCDSSWISKYYKCTTYNSSTKGKNVGHGSVAISVASLNKSCGMFKKHCMPCGFKFIINCLKHKNDVYEGVEVFQWNALMANSGLNVLISIYNFVFL